MTTSGLTKDLTTPRKPAGWFASFRIGTFVKFYRGNESRFMHEHESDYRDCHWIGKNIECRSCGARTIYEH